MVEVTIPPTMGAAIGFITSEPIPDSHRIGTRLSITTATVISFGRSRCTAPSITARLDPFVSERAGGDMTIQRFVKIDDHDDAGFDGDSKQRDIPNPHGDAEVEAHNVLKQQSARHGVNGRKYQYDRLSRGAEKHVEQHKDQAENDRQDDRQALSRAQLELILSRPFQGVSGGQM